MWTMQSAFHNLPTIDGAMQSPGRQFAARAVRYEANDDHVQLQLDIAAAYPKQANVSSWVRTIRLNRGKDIAITESYTLARPAQTITLTLLTPCRVKVQKEGELLLETIDGPEPHPAVRVLFDAGKLKPILETIPIEDAHLRAVWPEQLTRVLLKAQSPALQDRWTVRMEPAQSK
jgi:hypothetical protein